MIKIKLLFNLYAQYCEATTNVDTIFESCGMVNRYAVLDFGFFPLGSGVFTDNCLITSASLPECRIMVLGNDFGNLEYVEKHCLNNREREQNATIKNLLALNLDRNTTFFTNLYLGLRIRGKNTDEKIVKDKYQAFCITFFKKQLEFMNPSIVLCLGTSVMHAMTMVSPDFLKYENASVIKLYDLNSPLPYTLISEGRKYVFIPHPSYAHINWSKNDIKNRILTAILQ